MGYRNRMVMAIDEAINKLQKAREMVVTDEFPAEFDTSKFLVTCAEAASDVNFIVHEAGECMVDGKAKADR